MTTLVIVRLTKTTLVIARLTMTVLAFVVVRWEVFYVDCGLCVQQLLKLLDGSFPVQITKYL